MYFDLIIDCNNSLSQIVIFYLSQDDLKLLVYKKWFSDLRLVRGIYFNPIATSPERERERERAFKLRVPIRWE